VSFSNGISMKLRILNTTYRNWNDQVFSSK